MERNTDGGIWSVVILLIAIGMGAGLTVLFPKVSGYIQGVVKEFKSSAEEKVVIQPEEEDEHWDDSLRDGSIFTYRQYGSNPGEVEVTGFDHNYINQNYGGKLPLKVSIPATNPTGKDVKAIADSAFINASIKYPDLKSFGMADSIIKIGSSSFFKVAFEEIRFSNNLQEIGNNTFQEIKTVKEYIFPDTLHTIGAYVFGETETEKIYIPNVKNIGAEAFHSTKITGGYLTIPGSIETMGQSMLFKTDVDHLIFADTNNNIRLTNQTTGGQGNIKKLTIGLGYVSIGASAFSQSSLEKLYFNEAIIPTKTLVIENNAFQHNNLKKLTIPNHITEIGDNAFSENQIKEIKFNNGNLKKIGAHAFSKNKIKVLDLPNTLTNAGVYAFANNPIKELYIPDSLTTIGQGAIFNSSYSGAKKAYINSRTDIEIKYGAIYISGNWDSNLNNWSIIKK